LEIQNPKKNSGEGHRPLPRPLPVGRGIPLSALHPLRASGASIFAPTAFDLGARGASALTPRLRILNSLLYAGNVVFLLFAMDFLAAVGALGISCI